MAVLVVMVVRDRIAGLYQHPFFCPSKGVASRAFADQINHADPQNQFFKHPDDFDLYWLGLYDDVSGRWEMESQPELVLSGNSAKVSAE